MKVTNLLMSLMLINLIIFGFACGKDSTDGCASKNCPPESTCINNVCDCDSDCDELNPATNKCVLKDCGAGDCSGGNCNCWSGYEKDANGKCLTPIRDKFIGNYTTVDVCDNVTTTGTGSIAASPGYIFTIDVTNLGGTLGTIPAVVLDDSQIANLNSTSGEFILTSITSNTVNGVISWSFILTPKSTGQAKACTSTWTKI